MALPFVSADSYDPKHVCKKQAGVPYDASNRFYDLKREVAVIF